MSTAGWLSAAVEKTWLLEVGMVVLRSISLVKTPPSFQSRGQRRHVEENDVLNVTG